MVAEWLVNPQQRSRRPESSQGQAKNPSTPEAPLCSPPANSRPLPRKGAPRRRLSRGNPAGAGHHFMQSPGKNSAGRYPPVGIGARFGCGVPMGYGGPAQLRDPLYMDMAVSTALKTLSAGTPQSEHRFGANRVGFPPGAAALLSLATADPPSQQYPHPREKRPSNICTAQVPCLARESPRCMRSKRTTARRD